MTATYANISTDALGPLTWLHEPISADVSLSQARDAVEASIALLSNATEHFSMNRA